MTPGTVPLRARWQFPNMLCVCATEHFSMVGNLPVGKAKNMHSPGYVT